MNRTKLIAAASALAVISILQACGGGGGSGGGGDVPQANQQVAPATKTARTGDRNKAGNLFQASYENFRAQGSQPMPGALLGSTTARAFGNFFGPANGGQAGAFVAVRNYDGRVPGSTLASMKDSSFVFLRKNPDGSYGEPDGSLWDGSNAGCPDPTGTVLSDFNQDGKPDLFITCGGFPQAPFPGDTNRVVLSQPDGRYKVITVEAGADKDAKGNRPSFASSATADLNGDGHPDVVLVSNFQSPVVILFDPANNNFTREVGVRVNGLSFSNFTVHMVDVNGDGNLDLLIGGDETSPYSPAKSQVFLNEGDNRFGTQKPIVFPAVPAGNTKAYVLDYLVTGTTDADRTIWLLRRNPNRDNMTSVGRDIQKVRWADAMAGRATYTAVYSSNDSTVHRLMAGPKTGTQTPWVLSDDKNQNAPLEAAPGLEIK